MEYFRDSVKLEILTKKIKNLVNYRNFLSKIEILPKVSIFNGNFNFDAKFLIFLVTICTFPSTLETLVKT